MNFSRKSPKCGLLYFWQFINQNSSRFKNKTNDNLKLLGENPNHLQQFVKQNIAAVHLSSFLGKSHEWNICY